MPATIATSKSFLSTPSARRATRYADGHYAINQISIHALREEGDRGGVFVAASSDISIHALREEGDLVLDPGRQS